MRYGELDFTEFPSDPSAGSLVGKTVPLTHGQHGPQVGEATVEGVTDSGELELTLTITDPVLSQQFCTDLLAQPCPASQLPVDISWDPPAELVDDEPEDEPTVIGRVGGLE